MQKPFTVRDAVQSGMLISLFNQMVSRSVMQAAADELNLTVSDETVRKAIGQMPMFTDYDGSFSMAAYKQYLSDMGLSERRFIDDAFLDMRARQLTDAAETATIIPAGIVEMFYRLQNEKRTADVFTVKPADLKIKGAPGKADQERLYKELSDELVAPEYRTFTVMTLTLEDVSKKSKFPKKNCWKSTTKTKIHTLSKKSATLTRCCSRQSRKQTKLTPLCKKDRILWPLRKNMPTKPKNRPSWAI